MAPIERHMVPTRRRPVSERTERYPLLPVIRPNKQLVVPAAPVHLGLQERYTHFLYESPVGRIMLKLAVRHWVSDLAGLLLSTSVSRLKVKSFVRKNHIDLSEYEGAPYATFNDFFSRKIKPEARPVDPDPLTLVSPADSRLMVLPITENGMFSIKRSLYSAADLLRDAALAQRYLGGYAFIFRLNVDDYHRYAFPAAGICGSPRAIPGVLHTVNPLAVGMLPVYHRNAREVTLLDTETFGQLALVEVGALLVGRIVNHRQTGRVEKGQEKGYFQFGGSTVVVLVEPGRVSVSDELLDVSAAGREIRVLQGYPVAHATIVHASMSCGSSRSTQDAAQPDSADSSL